MNQRTVFIQPDERGFGLRVSGENPVFVESVKPGKRRVFEFDLLLLFLVF